MDLSATLTADLAALCASVATDPDTVTDPLHALNRDLRLTTRSYLGLELVLLDQGRAITLTAFTPGVRLTDVATSLHLPLAGAEGADGASTSPSEEAPDRLSGLTLYASRPGALVDLAADLSHACSTGSEASETAGGSVVWTTELSLDQHLPPRSVTPGLTGLPDVSTINRATGLLIGRGQTPDGARRELARQAAVAGASVASWSAQLLRRTGQPSR